MVRVGSGCGSEARLGGEALTLGPQGLDLPTFRLPRASQQHLVMGGAGWGVPRLPRGLSVEGFPPVPTLQLKPHPHVVKGRALLSWAAQGPEEWRPPLVWVVAHLQTQQWPSLHRYTTTAQSESLPRPLCPGCPVAALTNKIQQKRRWARSSPALERTGRCHLLWES